MGQHKYNPTAIAAKNGELPPKEKQDPNVLNDFYKMVRKYLGSSLQSQIGLTNGCYSL